MEEALRRIADMKDDKLDLGNMSLTELPHLPDGLDRLYCSNNPIIYPPADLLSRNIKDIKEWMHLHPLSLTKSALKQ